MRSIVLLAILFVLAAVAIAQPWDGSASVAGPDAPDASQAATPTPEFVGDPPDGFSSWYEFGTWLLDVRGEPVDQAGQPLLPDRPSASCDELQDAAGVPESARQPVSDGDRCPGITYRIDPPRLGVEND